MTKKEKKDTLRKIKDKRKVVKVKDVTTQRAPDDFIRLEAPEWAELDELDFETDFEIGDDGITTDEDKTRLNDEMEKRVQEKEYQEEKDNRKILELWNKQRG